MLIPRSCSLPWMMYKLDKHVILYRLIYSTVSLNSQITKQYLFTIKIRLLVHKGRLIYNGMLFKHETKPRVCHSYVAEILFYQNSQIHTRTLSFWWGHFFVNWLFGTKRWIKVYTGDDWTILTFSRQVCWYDQFGI